MAAQIGMPHQLEVMDAILALFGIDGSKRNITEFTLHCHVQEVPRIEITELVQRGIDMVPQTQKFRIEPIKEADPTPDRDAAVAKFYADHPDYHPSLEQIHAIQRIAQPPVKVTMNPQPVFFNHEIKTPHIPGEELAFAGHYDPPPRPITAEEHIRRGNPACPDCKGTGIYQPLVGPVEPCRTCGAKP